LRDGLNILFYKARKFNYFTKKNKNKTKKIGNIFHFLVDGSFIGLINWNETQQVLM